MSKYEPRVSILVPPIDDPYGAPHPVADKPIDVTCWTCHDCGKQGTGDSVHTCSPQVTQPRNRRTVTTQELMATKDTDVVAVLLAADRIVVGAKRPA